MKCFLKIFLAVVLLLSFSACRKNTTISSTNAYSSFGAVGVGNELDGSMTVRAWGKGKDKADALDQARKNAIHQVLFGGIQQGEGTYNGRPLIYEVNAQTKYEYYFNAFFVDGGEYTKYATFEDENRKARMVAKSNGLENWSTIIRVKRSELKSRLIEDGIIKP